MICIANFNDCCKCIFYTVLFLYIFTFYDVFHILLSCDSLGDPWNVYCIVLCCTLLYCIVLYRIVSYRVVSCRVVLYCIVLYCIVLYCIVLYCIVLYCIVLCCFVLYCIYCIVLYCIPSSNTCTPDIRLEAIPVISINNLLHNIYQKSNL